jgi:serine carboxypeptidase-like clade 2
MCDHYSPFSLWRYQYTFSPPLLTQEAKEKEDVCADENTDKYLNKKDVQKALHAKLVGIDKWSLCSK